MRRPDIFGVVVASLVVLSLAACALDREPTDPRTAPPAPSPPLELPAVRHAQPPPELEREPPMIPEQPTVWSLTFDEGERWRAAMNVERAAGSENVSVGTAPEGGRGRALAVLVHGSRDRSSRLGIDGRAPFEGLGIGPLEEATLSYSIFFPAGYDWVEGGKLPGLSGVVPGQPPWISANSDNGSHDNRQWSGRIMWQEGGTVISYLNVVHAAGRHHDDNRTDEGTLYSISPGWRRDGSRDGPRLAFQPGWNTVQLHYRMNTPGKNDGIHRGWLNGSLGVDLRDVQYRAAERGELDINQISSAVFYGGRLGPRTDQVLYLDDLAIGTPAA